MLYSEFTKKAKELTITKASNDLFYLEPDWRSILHENELFFDEISDYHIQPEEIKEVLELEVKKRNTILSNKPFVINWLYDLITTQIDPAMLAEETEFIKHMIEFEKTKNAGNVK